MSALYPFQRKFVADIDITIARGRRRILGVAPTGSGKTIIAADIVHRTANDGKRVLFLDHRIELTEQAHRKFYDAGIDAGIIQAGYKPRPGERVQIASVQTLHARAVRSRSVEAPDADLVIVDECHHIRARTYEGILALYPAAIILGLTATPCRGDGRGLGNIFDAIIEAPQVAELIAGGYLVPPRIYAPERPDLTGVRVRRGDYVENEAAERMDTPKLVGGVVEHWLRLNPERRKTVVFATGVDHSVHLRNDFRRAGVLAEHIDGDTPAEERDRILKHLASGEVEVVCNCAVLTEGFDLPDMGCLVLARPTKSLGLFRQMVGRVLRAAPNKKDALILDHAGVVFEHGLPDDPIEWTLYQDRRAQNSRHASRGTALGMPNLVECPECYAVRFEGSGCSVCGWRPRPKASAVEIVDGDLGEVRRQTRTVEPSILDKGRFHAMLLYIAAERRYRPGWAAHKFKEKFGHWPTDRYIDPIPPDDACRSWVRSRQIVYAKARQKAGAA